MAERAVPVGAVALDGRVEVWVVVQRRVIGGRAAARVAAHVPRRRRAQPQLPQYRVHRRRCHAQTTLYISVGEPKIQQELISPTAIYTFSWVSLRRRWLSLGSCPP